MNHRTPLPMIVSGFYRSHYVSTGASKGTPKYLGDRCALAQLRCHLRRTGAAESHAPGHRKLHELVRWCVGAGAGAAGCRLRLSMK